MPKSYRTAATSTREMAADRRKQLLKVGLLAIIAILVIFFLMQNSTSLGIGGIGVLGLLIAMRVILDQFDVYSRKKVKTIRRAERGAVAEEEIGDLLAELDESFVVIHDVASPYGNIDHVVISQHGGIYLLETKSHRGTVTLTESEILVNGHEPEKDFVGQALQNSYWLREEIEQLIQISPWVSPLVVFTNAFVKYGSPIKGVRAINRKYLLKTLQSHPSSSTNHAVIWANRERIASFLTGQPLAPLPPAIEAPPVYCTKCGQKLIEKVAKGGAQVGKRFMVCPDYPKCKTAIPFD